MGLLDKIKGNKKEETTVAGTDGKHKRSSSVGRRKSVEVKPAKVSSSSTTGSAVPKLPALNDTPTATYPVDGVSGVNGKEDRHGVSGLSRDLEKTHVDDASAAAVRPKYDERNLTNTPFDVAGFLGNKESSTDYQQSQAPAVVQETIKPQVTEIVTPIHHREHHVVHHQTRIQPVLEQIILPPKHYVIIEGKKYEILAEAVTQHVLKQRDYIPMTVKPQVVVREYVDAEPLVGPITGVGASLVNESVAREHQLKINESYAVKPLQPTPIPTAAQGLVPVAQGSGHGVGHPVAGAGAVPVAGHAHATKGKEVETHRHSSLKDKLLGKSDKHEPARV